MLWRAPIPADVASPATVKPLLEQALSSHPGHALLHAKLGYLHLDSKEFAAAAQRLEAALAIDRARDHDRILLARCYNYLGRHGETIDLLRARVKPSSERGKAYLKLGRTEEAEAEFRACLGDDPDEAEACRMLARLLRKSGRITELVTLCEDLSARGATNSQWLFTWGAALALAGDWARARRLMFEPERVTQIQLDLPGKITAALAEDILANPNRLSRFPTEDEANRGSTRVDNLFTGRRTDLLRKLLASLQEAVTVYQPLAHSDFDPWPALRPAVARLRPWGLVQSGGDYEEGHIHTSGWLSGVFYARIPPAVAAGTGPGCIEFGPPNAVAEAVPGLVLPRKYVPKEGLLILSPSHFQHRTIPSGLTEQRVSIAFDVVPSEAPRDELSETATM